MSVSGQKRARPASVVDNNANGLFNTLTSQNLTTTEDLQVNDDATVEGDLTVNTAATINGTLDVTGATTLEATQVNTTLGVTGTTTAAQIDCSGVDAGSGTIETTGSLEGGALTITSGTSSVAQLNATGVDAGSGTIETTGALQGGAATVTSLDAGSGVIETTGGLEAATLTLGGMQAFTPTLLVGATSQTMSVAVGRYFRLADIVFIHIQLTWTKSADTGTVTIGALPETITTDRTSFNIGHMSRWTLAAGYTFVARGLPGGTVINILTLRDGSTALNVDDTYLSAGAVELQLDGWYRAA